MKRISLLLLLQGDRINSRGRSCTGLPSIATVHQEEINSQSEKTSSAQIPFGKLQSKVIRERDSSLLALQFQGTKMLF